MTTPIACQTCVHWHKHREKSCNWGTCSKITNCTMVAATLNCSDPSLSLQLVTRDTFYCAFYEFAQPPHKFTVVDAAREAATKIGKEVK